MEKQQQLAHKDEIEKYNYKLIVAYDGTNYKGFQLQAGKKVQTIQGKLEKALIKKCFQTREKLRLQSAGRTDAGVHARGQVVQFFSPRYLGDDHKITLSLNTMLPSDIRITETALVPPDFDVKSCTISKTYKYQVCTNQIMDPWNSKYSLHCPWIKDWDLVREGASMMEGKHDFAMFCNLTALKPETNTVRTINSFNIIDGFQKDEKVFVVNSKGFLYKQVRHMVGALIAVGIGKMRLSQLQEALQAGREGDESQLQRWSVASAHGLFLEHVQYPPHSDPNQLMFPKADFWDDCVEQLERG